MSTGAFEQVLRKQSMSEPVFHSPNRTNNLQKKQKIPIFGLFLFFFFACYENIIKFYGSLLTHFDGANT